MKGWLAYLSGRFVAADELALSVEDLGFLYGATVTERLRTFGGHVFRLSDHLARLTDSLAAVGIAPPLDDRGWSEVLTRLVAENLAHMPAAGDLGLVLFVTPGLPGAEQPTVCAYTYPLPFARWATKYRRGESLVIARTRQVPAESWPAHVKCRSRMHYYLADREPETLAAGGQALLLDAAGYVTETSTSNVLVYRAKEGVVSPPLEKILPGVSRQACLELAVEAGLPVSERDLLPVDLAQADEVWLTSTASCLLPVARLNGLPVGGGVPGPLAAKLLAAWSQRVGVEIAFQAVSIARAERVDEIERRGAGS